MPKGKSKVIPYKRFLERRRVTRSPQKRRVENARPFDPTWRLQKINEQYRGMEELKERRKELLERGIKPEIRNLKRIIEENAQWIRDKLFKEIGIKIKWGEAKKQAKKTAEYRDTDLAELEDNAEFLLTMSEIERREGKLAESTANRLRATQLLQELEIKRNAFNRTLFGEEETLTRAEKESIARRIIPLQEARIEPFRTFREMILKHPTLYDQQKQLLQLKRNRIIMAGEITHYQRVLDELIQKRWGRSGREIVKASIHSSRILLASFEAQYHSISYVMEKQSGVPRKKTFELAKASIENMHRMIERKK